MLKGAIMNHNKIVRKEKEPAPERIIPKVEPVSQPPIPRNRAILFSVGCPCVIIQEGKWNSK